MKKAAQAVPMTDSCDARKRILAGDEELHPVGADPHWQESFYFNWADPRGEAFGLARIGYRFNEQRVDGVLLTMRKGRPEYVYAPVNLRLDTDPTQLRASEGFRSRGLCFRMEEPLRRWQILLDSEAGDKGALTWTAFTPMFSFHGEGAAKASMVAQQHVEQSGTIEGYLELHGRRQEIRGYGQRDKSWGPRDWASIKGWNWIAAQFGEDLSFNATTGFEDGKPVINGFVYRDGEHYALRDVTVEHEWGLLPQVPVSTRIVMRDERGRQYEVTSRAIAQFPLTKKGFYIQETHSLFEMRIDGRLRQGVGVVEYAWHAGTFKTLVRAPLLLGAYLQARRGPRS